MKKCRRPEYLQTFEQLGEHHGKTVQILEKEDDTLGVRGIGNSNLLVPTIFFLHCDFASSVSGDAASSAHFQDKQLQPDASVARRFRVCTASHPQSFCGPMPAMRRL
jgi:hypothetical protein